MAFSEIERKRIEKEVGAHIESKRPASHIRPQFDIGWRLTNQSVEIFEMRPHWQDASKIMEHSVAKATYVKTQGKWKIFWLRADLKWHGYEPKLWVRKLSGFLAEVEADPYGCFWG